MGKWQQRCNGSTVTQQGQYNYGPFSYSKVLCLPPGQAPKTSLAERVGEREGNGDSRPQGQ